MIICVTHLTQTHSGTPGESNYMAAHKHKGPKNVYRRLHNEHRSGSFCTGWNRATRVFVHLMIMFVLLPFLHVYFINAVTLECMRTDWSSIARCPTTHKIIARYFARDYTLAAVRKYILLHLHRPNVCRCALHEVGLSDCASQLNARAHNCRGAVQARVVSSVFARPSVEDPVSFRILLPAWAERSAIARRIV